MSNNTSVPSIIATPPNGVGKADDRFAAAPLDRLLSQFAAVAVPTSMGDGDDAAAEAALLSTMVAWASARLRAVGRPPSPPRDPPLEPTALDTTSPFSVLSNDESNASVAALAEPRPAASRGRNSLQVPAFQLIDGTLSPLPLDFQSHANAAQSSRPAPATRARAASDGPAGQRRGESSSEPSASTTGWEGAISPPPLTAADQPRAWYLEQGVVPARGASPYDHDATPPHLANTFALPPDLSSAATGSLAALRRRKSLTAPVLNPADRPTASPAPVVIPSALRVLSNSPSIEDLDALGDDGALGDTFRSSIGVSAEFFPTPTAAGNPGSLPPQQTTTSFRSFDSDVPPPLGRTRSLHIDPTMHRRETQLSELELGNAPFRFASPFALEDSLQSSTVNRPLSPPSGSVSRPPGTVLPPHPLDLRDLMSSAGGSGGSLTSGLHSSHAQPHISPAGVAPVLGGGLSRLSSGMYRDSPADSLASPGLLCTTPGLTATEEPSTVRDQDTLVDLLPHDARPTPPTSMRDVFQLTSTTDVTSFAGLSSHSTTGNYTYAPRRGGKMLWDHGDAEAVHPLPPRHPSVAHAPLPALSPNSGSILSGSSDAPDAHDLSRFVTGSYSDIVVAQSGATGSPNNTSATLLRLRAKRNADGAAVTIFRRQIIEHQGQDESTSGPPTARGTGTRRPSAAGAMSTAHLMNTSGSAQAFEMENIFLREAYRCIAVCNSLKPTVVGLLKPLDAFVDSSYGTSHGYMVYEQIPPRWQGYRCRTPASASAPTLPSSPNHASRVNASSPNPTPLAHTGTWSETLGSSPTEHVHQQNLMDSIETHPSNSRATQMLREFLKFLWDPSEARPRPEHVAYVCKWLVISVFTPLLSLHLNGICHGAVHRDIYVIAAEGAQQFYNARAAAANRDNLEAACDELQVLLGPIAMRTTVSKRNTPASVGGGARFDIEDAARHVMEAIAFGLGLAQDSNPAVEVLAAVVAAALPASDSPFFTDLMVSVMTAPHKHTAVSIIAAVDAWDLHTAPNCGIAKQLSTLRDITPVLAVDARGIIRYANADCDALIGSALVTPERRPLHIDSVLATRLAPQGTYNNLPSDASSPTTVTATSGSGALPATFVAATWLEGLVSGLGLSVPSEEKNPPSTAHVALPPYAPAQFGDGLPPNVHVTHMATMAAPMRVEVQFLLLTDKQADVAMTELSLAAPPKVFMVIRPAGVDLSLTVLHRLRMERRAIAEYIPVPCVSTGADGQYLDWASIKAAQMFGFPPSAAKRIKTRRLLAAQIHATSGMLVPTLGITMDCTRIFPCRVVGAGRYLYFASCPTDSPTTSVTPDWHRANAAFHLALTLDPEASPASQCNWITFNSWGVVTGAEPPASRRHPAVAMLTRHWDRRITSSTSSTLFTSETLRRLHVAQTLLVQHADMQLSELQTLVNLDLAPCCEGLHVTPHGVIVEGRVRLSASSPHDTSHTGSNTNTVTTIGSSQGHLTGLATSGNGDALLASMSSSLTISMSSSTQTVLTPPGPSSSAGPSYHHSNHTMDVVILVEPRFTFAADYFTVGVLPRAVETTSVSVLNPPIGALPPHHHQRQSSQNLTLLPIPMTTALVGRSPRGPTTSTQVFH